MTNTILVHLSGLSGEKRLFLSTPEFASFAQNAWFNTPSSPGPSKSVYAKNVCLPQDVLQSLAPIIINQTVVQPFGPPLDLNKEFRISSGSSENDLYLHLQLFVKTFDTYASLMAYASENNFVVDEKNGFDGSLERDGTLDPSPLVGVLSQKRQRSFYSLFMP